MKRIVLPELLDVLPPQDAAALRSRRELRRINGWMRHSKIMARALERNAPGPGPGIQQLAELGAGDGHFLLSVARRLNGQWLGANATLVDRLDAMDPWAAAQFNRLGWQVKTEIAEATDWLRRAPETTARTIVSNLFFHQFENDQLSEMLRLAADSARMVIAVEPRRSLPARLAGRLLWAIGCGHVTRHDARVSVRAGFAGNELSALWPDKDNWEITERAVGLFSHLFVARRRRT